MATTLTKSAASWSGPDATRRARFRQAAAAGANGDRKHHGGHYRGNDHHGQTGADEFERRLQRLLNGERLGADIEEVLKLSVPGGYKDRPVDGRLLHYALWRDAQGQKIRFILPACPGKASAQQAESVKAVLSARADPNGMLYNLAFKHKQEIPPIVFGASLGHVPGILQLVDKGVDINLHAVMDGNPHYCAIHDAVFLEKLEAVRVLIKHEADINLKNRDGLTALHLAAWVGAEDIAEELVSSCQFSPCDLYTKARVRRETELIEHLNPLELATFQTWYPPEKLTILMPFTYGRGSFFEVIRSMIREEKRSAVSRLLDGIERAADEDDTELGNDLKHKIKMEALKRRGQYSKLCRKRGHTMIGFMAEVITRAPKVAAQILDLLTGRPYVKRTNVTRHPLPLTSDLASRDHIGRLFGHNDPMITAYEHDYMDQDLAYQGMLSTYAKECKYRPLGIPEWKFDTRNNLVPEWHKHFAPKESQNHNPCQVMVLMLPNILDVRIIHALNVTDDVNIWAYPACQCMNYHLWACVVHRAFYVRVVFEIVLALTLSYRAILRDGDVRLSPEERRDNLYDPMWSFSMSIVLAAGMKEVFLLCHRFYAHTKYYRLPRTEFFNQRSDVFHCVPQWAQELLLSLLLLAFAYFAMTEMHVCIGCEEEDEQQLRNSTWNSTGLEQEPQSMVDLVADTLDQVIAGGEVEHHPPRVWAGSLNLLLLTINTFVRWLYVMVLLRGATGMGEKFLAIIHSFNPMSEIFAILAFGVLALFSSILAFRGQAPIKKVFWWVLFGVFCGDGAALNQIMKLDRDLFKGWVSFFMVLCLLILMTLMLMNLIIGVFGNAFTECEDLKRLYFLRSRNLICEQLLLEPVWPRTSTSSAAAPTPDQGSEDSDENDDDALAGRTRGLLFSMRSGRRAICRWRLPEMIMQRKWMFSGGLFVLALLVIFCLPNRRWLVVCQGVVLAAFQICLQAACVQSDIMDADMLLNGLEPEDKDDDELDQSEMASDDGEEEDDDEESDELGIKERCLWMCVRADFDKDFYQHDAQELRETVDGLKDNIKDIGGRLDFLMQKVDELQTSR